MILGLLSDTHGRHRRTACALALLERLGAEAFVHCGDVGGQKVLDELAGRRTWLVWGNADSSDPRNNTYAEHLGLPPPREIPLRIGVDGCRFAVYHGHESSFARLARRIRNKDFTTFNELTAGTDYILYGHTHAPTDLRVGRVRLINPGALERARAHTVATLDVSRDLLRFWQVDEHANASELPRPFTPGRR